jgi:hypothetical protein
LYALWSLRPGLTLYALRALRAFGAFWADHAAKVNFPFNLSVPIKCRDQVSVIDIEHRRLLAVIIIVDYQVSIYNFRVSDTEAFRQGVRQRANEKTHGIVTLVILICAFYVFEW